MGEGDFQKNLKIMCASLLRHVHRDMAVPRGPGGMPRGPRGVAGRSQGRARLVPGGPNALWGLTGHPWDPVHKDDSLTYGSMI